MNNFFKGILGAIIGASTAGFWLYMDLILPEPFGDYLLFTLMGVVHAIIGWQVARLIGKSRDKVKELESKVATSDARINPKKL